MKNDVKVGISVFVALVLLFFLTTQVGSFKNYGKEGYSLYAMLNNAAGLETNSKVKANGIDVGYIKSLAINGNKVRVNLFINDGVNIPSNSVLVPMQSSLLGGKYAEIELGDDTHSLDENSMLSSDKGLASINKASDSMMDAADEFKAFILEFREVFDASSRDSLRNTFVNLEAITSELREFTKVNKLNEVTDNFNKMATELSQTSQKFAQTADTLNGKLPTIMTNLDHLVQDLQIASQKIKVKFPALADKFTAIGSNLEAILNENRQPLNATINSADTFFSVGEDTFSKVDALLETIDKVQLEVAMRGEWMGKDQYSKGFLSLDYKPSDSKSYRFDVAGMDDFSRLDVNNILIEPKLHEETNLLFSAQIAKRFEDIALRAGLIENTFGAGLDYYLLYDRLKASADFYDLNAENDVRGKNLHAKASARYTFLKHIDFYAGVDNFLNEDASNVFVGLGVRFYDDDLKTLVMSQNLGSFAK